MTPHDYDSDDPWMRLSGGDAPIVADTQQPVLRIEIIEAVEPLDAQFGIYEKKTVPDTLHDVLFGQPKPTETEIEAAGGDASAVPPMQTYAILDAAKVINLLEFLEESGLEHLCLFKGDAYDELKNVAPWIVRLEKDNNFTRNLFTHSDAFWHLWDNEPGIYIRSRGSLSDMWRHFRKFTRVPDGSGKWFYFRFWEDDILLYVPPDRLAAIIPDQVGSLLIRSVHNGACAFHVVHRAGVSTERPLTLDDKITAGLAAWRGQHLVESVTNDLVSRSTVCADSETHRAAADAYLDYARRCGLNDQSKQTAFVRIAARFGLGFAHDAQHPALRQVIKDPRISPSHRIALMRHWEAYAGPGEIDLNRALDALRVAFGQSSLPSFEVVNPTKVRLRDERNWRVVRAGWKDWYRRVFPDATEATIDRLLLVAFILGQYFYLDPYRQKLVRVAEDGRIKIAEVTDEVLSDGR